MVRRSLIALGVSALAVPLVVVGGLGSAGAAPSMVRLSGSTLPSARLAANNPAVARSARVRFQVQLRLRDQAGADALARAVSTPGSAQYRQYLTPDQYRARFSPTQASVDTVSAWLASQGLKITGVPANRAFIEAEGSAAQVEKTFQTSLVTVDANGKQRRVNTSEPAVPANLIASIDGVTGLSDVLMRPTHVGGADEAPASASAQAAEAAAAAVGADAPPTPGFRVAPPCSAFWNEKQATELHPVRQLPEPAAVGALRLQAGPAARRPTAPPASLASGIDGSGVTVAIVDAYASPTIVSDATTYAQRNDPTHPFKKSKFSQKAYRPFTTAAPTSATRRAGTARRRSTSRPCTPWRRAPTSTSSASRAATTSTSSPALNDLVDGHKADIVSNSYGNLG